MALEGETELQEGSLGVMWGKGAGDSKKGSSLDIRMRPESNPRGIWGRYLTGYLSSLLQYHYKKIQNLVASKVKQD